MEANTVVIFDFDCTLVEVDSDPWVAEQLGASAAMEELRSHLPWNTMMMRLCIPSGVAAHADALMGVLHAKGNTISDIEEALRRIPLELEKITAIKLAHALGCELHIVSDANSFFIKTILDKYEVTNLFTDIHTNPASVDGDGRLRIAPFHAKSETPHGCPLCPPNMCKGKILDEIQAQMTHGRKRIVYIGDGPGDYCPSSRLQEGDCILPREGFPLLEMLTQNMSSVRASIHPWSSAKIMEEKLLALLEPHHVLEENVGLESMGGTNCTKCAMPLVDQANEVISSMKTVYA